MFLFYQQILLALHFACVCVYQERQNWDVKSRALLTQIKSQKPSNKGISSDLMLYVVNCTFPILSTSLCVFYHCSSSGCPPLSTGTLANHGELPNLFPVLSTTFTSGEGLADRGGLPLPQHSFPSLLQQVRQGDGSLLKVIHGCARQHLMRE